MGLGPNRHCRTADCTYPRAENALSPIASAPDPRNWNLLRARTVTGLAGTCTVLMLQYPDCTNFEGRKVLVYDGAMDVDTSEPLDPHFSDDGDGPIARFPPDETGWVRALAFADVMANVRPT